MLCSKTRFFSSNAVPPFLGGHFPLLEESLNLVKKRENVSIIITQNKSYQHLQEKFWLWMFNWKIKTHFHRIFTEKAMAPHSSTLAWKIPWTEEPGRLQSMGLLGVWHDWATSLSLFTFMHWRRKWQPTPMFLLENPRDGGAWWAAVSGVTQSRTRLKRRSSSSSREAWRAAIHGVIKSWPRLSDWTELNA